MKNNKGLTRKQFLKNTLLGVGGIITGAAVLGGCGDHSYLRDSKRGPATKGMPFNTDWLFGGEAMPGSLKPNFDDSRFENVNLPHTVTDLSWHQWDPKSWEKIWIYRRHFHFDKEDLQGRRVFLNIGAAMTSATLSLNGHKLDNHVGGYLPFDRELTGYLQSGENVLAVKLDSHFKINVPPNKPPKGPRSIDFWQPGGIYRSARLHVVPQVFLRDIFAKPVNVLDSNRQLEVECKVDAAVVPNQSARIEIEVRDRDGKVGAASVPVQISKKGIKTVNTSVKNLGDVHLWDINDPYLYDVIATLVIDEEPVHDYAVRTGFREAKFTEKGFYLNGKRIQLFGVNRHQFYPYAGGAMPDRVQAKDAEILRKNLNCNMVRCSHYPQSEAFFDACDEMGLMAWEEAPGWGMWLGNKQWKQRVVRDVEQMVRRDRNHPSIIVWGARLNETPNDIELYTKTRNLAHKLDNSRQTTGAMIGGTYDTDEFVQDVFSFNDYSRTKTENGVRMPRLKPPRTDFPYFVSEAVGTLSGPAKYYRRTDPVAIQQGQAEAHAIVHDIAATDKRYCGLAVWCGYDYPSGSGNQYKGTKYNGVIDLFRVPKLGAAIYQAQVDPKKRAVIIPAFYWDFGPKSLPMKGNRKVMICSNCQRLELLVDGKHYTTVNPSTKRMSHLPYPPSFVNFNKVDASTKPELRIDGYVQEEKVISRSFSSDPDGDQLYVAADDKEIIANGSDATRVMFRAVDKYGAPRPYVKKDVQLKLNGPATLIGQTPFPFEANGGVGAVWIRSQPNGTGKIHLRAVHPVLGSGEVTITAR